MPSRSRGIQHRFGPASQGPQQPQLDRSSARPRDLTAVQEEVSRAALGVQVRVEDREEQRSTGAVRSEPVKERRVAPKQTPRETHGGPARRRGRAGGPLPSADQHRTSRELAVETGKRISKICPFQICRGAACSDWPD
ncbi:hypothetical protein ISCGN_019793 [Ixodes scapularis]